MPKRCMKPNCKKVARYIENNKMVCKNHRCRCHISKDERGLFSGCYIHGNMND